MPLQSNMQAVDIEAPSDAHKSTCYPELLSLGCIRVVFDLRRWSEGYSPGIRTA